MTQSDIFPKPTVHLSTYVLYIERARNFSAYIGRRESHTSLDDSHLASLDVSRWRAPSFILLHISYIFSLHSFMFFHISFIFLQNLGPKGGGEGGRCLANVIFTPEVEIGIFPSSRKAYD